MDNPLSSFNWLNSYTNITMPKYFSCQDLNTVYVYISVNHGYVEVCVHMSMPCM